MKRLLYEKMESMFHLIDHDHKDTGALEMLIYKLARGNTFQMRVVGMEAMKEFRAEHPASPLPTQDRSPAPTGRDGARPSKWHAEARPTFLLRGRPLLLVVLFESFGSPRPC